MGINIEDIIKGKEKLKANPQTMSLEDFKNLIEEASSEKQGTPTKPVPEAARPESEKPEGGG